MEKDGGGDFVGEAGGKNVGVREIENEAGQKRSGSGKETATDEKKKRESEGAKDDDAQTNANEIAAKEVHSKADEIEGEGGMDAVEGGIRVGKNIFGGLGDGNFVAQIARSNLIKFVKASEKSQEKEAYWENCVFEECGHIISLN